MKVQLNPQRIKEMCGTISYKRGDSFFRADKVIVESISDDHCRAIVIGAEEFDVTVKMDHNGELQTDCSCPKLASFDYRCQHVAAVLIAIYEYQGQGKLSQYSKNQEMSSGLITLFQEQRTATSRHLSHFEKREVLPITFICKSVAVEKERYFLAIQLKIDTVKVQDIRFFLEQVRDGKPCRLSGSFVFDQKIHCFCQNSESVLQELILIMEDEKIYSAEMREREILLIPPSSWDGFMTLLKSSPHVKLEFNGEWFNELRMTDELLPLQFDFTEAEGEDYQLVIHGLDSLIILDSYHYVLYDGNFKQLEEQDCRRLVSLKKMLISSGTNQIAFSKQQISNFMEQTVPGLKKLGHVVISKSLTNRLKQMPLIAKLYLDRVKNRLLAGLEFHYGHQFINPLESRGTGLGSMLIRDIEKEEEILALMEQSSFTKTDEGYFLHNEMLEYEFLYHIIPKLQNLVQIYATTAVRNRIIHKNAHPCVRVSVKKERINWLEFKFEMDGIPEKQIKDILSALEEKRKYYRLRDGTLLSLETKEMQEIQHFLHMPYVQKKNPENILDVPIEHCFQLLDTVESGNVFKIEESFHEFLENLLHPGKLVFEVPNNLENILRDYQKVGFYWMKTMARYRFGGILADDMGLGKTIQSIAFILSELNEIRANKKPVMIVCPSSLTYNWLSEFMTFSPQMEAVIIDGNKNERTNLQKRIKDIDVLITSYPLLRRDIKWYESQAFHTVIFDEAQNFKNPLTQTARAVKKLNANYRFALTGTPIENAVQELWSIFHVVFPELFGGLKDFSKLTREQVAQRIRPFILRRIKEDVLTELPGKMESIEAVELFAEQKKLYGAYLAKLRHDTLKHLDKDTIRKNRIKILAGLTRLRQICCHPGLFVEGYKGGSAKFEQLLRIIEESKLSGRRVLIFSQFTKMLELIAREFTTRGLDFFYLDGQTSSEKRLTLVNQFNSGERDYFLISLKAGGTGLNLMTADTVILYDSWWNPAVEEQAADRAHRMGQTRTVEVIKLVSRGTIEEKMNELQEKKRRLIKEIIDTDEGILSALTEEEIRELLMIK